MKNVRLAIKLTVSIENSNETLSKIFKLIIKISHCTHHFRNLRNLEKGKGIINNFIIIY